MTCQCVQGLHETSDSKLVAHTGKSFCFQGIQVLHDRYRFYYAEDYSILLFLCASVYPVPY